MASAKSNTEKSIVAITKGTREEAKKVIREGLELMGGINSLVKKGDTVLLKPNMGYPPPPDMPPWTNNTDVLVLTALTELCLEAGAKKVITGDGCAHGVKARYLFPATGVQEAIEKVGGEISYFDEEPYLTREVPGGILLKEQALPKVVLDADVIINVPKIKSTVIGRWTLGFKNLFGLIPYEERSPWHRMPENFYLLADLMKLVKPALTVMDGFIIKEGVGTPHFGTPVNLGVVVMSKDPVAAEAVAVSVIGHEPHEQAVLAIAEKYGVGTTDLDKIEVRGKSIDSVRINTRLAAGEVFVNPLPNVVEYVGGACLGCSIWIQNTPFPWEVDENKTYALVVGGIPRLPEKFTEDEVIVLGTCAMYSKAEIWKACPEGVTPRVINGCPPREKRIPGFLKLHGMDKLPHMSPTNYVKG